MVCSEQRRLAHGGDCRAKVGAWPPRPRSHEARAGPSIASANRKAPDEYTLQTAKYPSMVVSPVGQKWTPSGDRITLVPEGPVQGSARRQGRVQVNAPFAMTAWPAST